MYSFYRVLSLLHVSVVLQSCAFVPPSSIKRCSNYPFALTGSLADSFDHFSRELGECTTPEIQKLLVQKGVEFKQRQEEGNRNKNESTASSQQQQPPLLQSPLEKVPGCVANVYVQTNLREQSSRNGYEVTFSGTADALLSRGLLAVLTMALTTTAKDNLESILAVDPCSVADQLGIRKALSPGRNDGLANMMKIIQQQIKALMKLGDKEKENSGSEPATANINVAPLYVDEIKVEPLASSPTEKPKSEQPTNLQSKESTSSSKTMPTVALLLSGGVDSSVALRLLLQQGYDVTAFYLKIWLEDELAHLGQCPWEDDYNMCRQVCEQARVPLESLSLQEEYRDQVISYTIQEAQRGRTPNPDILCNSRVKFGCFYDAIAEQDFDFVASGHYARLEPTAADRISITEETAASKEECNPVRLFRAPDPVKDQSYFLCALNQEQLKRVIFPIGHLEKARVRELANEFELPNRQRPDSQGLCFLGKVKFEEFLGAYLGERPGDIVDAKTGDILGRHRGVWYHTVGQRKGIGKVLFPLATSRGPWYVVAKDPDHDLVFCSNEYDEEMFAAARSEFHVEDIQWVTGGPPPDMNNSARFDMKIRHGPRIVSGELTISSSAGDEGTVKLDKKDGGLAPGQFVVFYNGEECLGGGVISERHWAKFLTQREESSVANATTVPP